MLNINELCEFFFELIGRPPDLLNYEDRLRIMKLAYILRIVKKDDTIFGWFIRGPYSPEIARRLFP